MCSAWIPDGRVVLEEPSTNSAAAEELFAPFAAASIPKALQAWASFPPLPPAASLARLASGGSNESEK